MLNTYLDVALDEALKAYSNNEVPVGAVVVKNGQIIAKAHNIKNKYNSVFTHAEILAIIKAAKKVGDWRLCDCEMYVTLEPCPMCASAIQQKRIKKVYIGTKSNISENSQVILNILQNKCYNHYVECIYLNDIKSSKLLTDFFSFKR